MTQVFTNNPERKKDELQIEKLTAHLPVKKLDTTEEIKKWLTQDDERIVNTLKSN